MHEEMTPFALTCRDDGAPAPVLVGVQAEGRLDAVLFGLTLRQTYRNTSDRVLEVVYTFPLPYQAVLLGFASELNGERQEGAVVARRVAEQRYEASLAQGDAPVMLEALGDGLHTANIGNLKPGDEIVLECRFVQLLRFEQGRLRLSIPTTIAPRYGSAQQAGLQPQQVPEASFDADYPLTLSITLGQALSGAKAECPTHRFEATAMGDGAIRLDLAPAARLDRDVVVIVTPREPRPSLVVRANDASNASAPVVMMAALQPASGVPRDRVALKLLVDCSGSMCGDSIASARTALQGVVDGLGEQDRICVSCFGSAVDHRVEPTPGTPQALRHVRTVIDDIQADLGGTEMASALCAVFQLPLCDEHGGGDVLLITDGNIWHVDETIAAARANRHRVFVIGVGAAPVEGSLRRMAEATGGACELATPGEALEAAALRMLGRIRQPPRSRVRVEWGASPVWSSGPDESLFGGDTLIALAGFGERVDCGTVRLLADDAQGQTVELARGEATAPCPGDALPRLAASRRLGGLSYADELALAVQYQLMSPYTHCVLVHERAAADKAAEQAELHRVHSMMAAGWAGLGTEPIAAFAEAYRSGHRTRLLSMEGDHSVDRVRSPRLAGTSVRHSVRLAEGMEWLPASLESMARSVAEHLRAVESLEGLTERMAGLTIHVEARGAILEAMSLGLTFEQAWLVLAHWVHGRSVGTGDAAVSAALEPFVRGLDTQILTAATEVMERTLGGYPDDGWVSSREQRLRRAIGLEDA